MIENQKIMGISPHIVGFQNRGVNRDALPSDSVFTTPEAMARTFPIHMLATYAVTPSHLRSSIIDSVATNLVTDPTQLPHFWFETSSEKLTNDDLKPISKEFKKNIVPKLNEAASKIDTFSITEEGIVSLFSTLHSSPTETVSSVVTESANAIWLGYMNGTIHKSMIGLNAEEIQKRIVNGNIKLNELQYTQDRIVHLLYTLTNGVIKTRDDRLMNALHDLLSFRTASLGISHPHSGLQASAGFSLNNDTLAKAVLVDFTNSLLEATFHPGEDTAGANLEKTIENSPAGKKYLHLQKAINLPRDRELVEFYTNRYGKLGQISTPDEEAEIFFSRPLPFPENIIYSAQHELWPEYLKLFSEYAKKNNLMQKPLEILYFPDGSVRHVALVDGDSFEAAHDTLKYIAQQPGEIEHPQVIESFLTYLRPQIVKDTVIGLEEKNQPKRKSLIESPSHGLSTMGLTIEIDESSIEAQSLSIDQSATFLDVRIENAILHMRLNDQYELCSLDGKPLTLDRATSAWWDHVILPQLYRYICVPLEMNDGYMDGVETIGDESPQEATRRVITKRVGYFRKLGITPDGKECHHTKHQRDAVYERRYVLPKTERLDLDVKNADKPFGEKVTFVLPIEKELAERPVFHLPGAYKDDNEILTNDPCFTQS